MCPANSDPDHYNYEYHNDYYCVEKKIYSSLRIFSFSNMSIKFFLVFLATCGIVGFLKLIRVSTVDGGNL